MFFFALVECNRKWRNAAWLYWIKCREEVNAKVDSYEQAFVYHVRYLTHLSMSMKNVQNVHKKRLQCARLELNKMTKWIVSITQNTYHSFEIVNVMSHDDVTNAITRRMMRKKVNTFIRLFCLIGKNVIWICLFIITMGWLNHFHFHF